MNSVLIAPKNYLWHTPENTVVGSHLGNSSDTLREISPNSGGSSLAGSVEWNTRFPDGLVESTPRLRSELTFTLGNVAGADFAAKKATLQNKIGVSSFPLNRMIENATVELNGHSVNTYVSQSVDAIVQSSDPMTLALISQASETDDYERFDSQRSNDPLASGGDATDSQKSRGLGCNYLSTITDGGGAIVIVKVVLEEALMCEPFQYQEIRTAQPFKNINSFILNLNLKDIASRVINLGSFVPAPQPTVTLTTARHSLLIRTWNPSVREEIPRSLVYNAPKVERKYVGGVNVPTGATNVAVSLNNFTINSVPSMFAICVRRPTVANQPISFLPITNVGIDMDNKTALLNQLTPYQLYLLSSKNGYTKRFSTFASELANPLAADANHGCGSWLLVRPSDLGLNEGTMSNAAKILNVRLDLRVDAVGSADEACVPEVYTITDNFLYDRDGTFDDVRPSLSPEKLLASPIQYTGEDRSLNRVLGGSWWGDVWSRIKQIVTHPMTKRVVKHIRNTPGVARYVGDDTLAGRAANIVGYGKVKKVKKGKKGGELVRMGGKKLTAGELHTMLA